MNQVADLPACMGDARGETPPQLSARDAPATFQPDRFRRRRRRTFQPDQALGRDELKPEELPVKGR